MVIEKERARDSRSVEVVGTYNPVAKPAAVNLKHDRIAHWMKNGAQPSDTVARLLKNNPAPAAVPGSIDTAPPRRATLLESIQQEGENG